MIQLEEVARPQTDRRVNRAAAASGVEVAVGAHRIEDGTVWDGKAVADSGDGLADSVADVVAEDMGRPETAVSYVAGTVEVEGEQVGNTSKQEALNTREQAILATRGFYRCSFVVGIASAGSADLAQEVVPGGLAVCHSDIQDLRLRM